MAAAEAVAGIPNDECVVLKARLLQEVKQLELPASLFDLIIAELILPLVVATSTRGSTARVVKVRLQYILLY